MAIDQQPADALERFGDAANWQGEAPSRSIGFTTVHGTWPERPGYAAKGRRALWPNPAYGGVLINPGRFGSIPEWQPARATGWFLFDFLRQLKQFELDLAAIRRPLMLPWDDTWTEVGGTQGQSADNGVIVLTSPDGSTAYEIQGMARIGNDLSGLGMIADLNRQALAPVAKIGDYRCDAITLRRPGAIPVGSQGPKWKGDGLIRPEYLTRFLPDLEARLVLFNVEAGPTARFVRPGRVEHPRNEQPYPGHAVTLPLGVDARMVPSFTGFALDMTDDDRELWIGWCLTQPAAIVGGATVAARRCFANNLRGYETDAQKPRVRKTRVRCSESGTGYKILESVGTSDPTARAGFAASGIVTDRDANQIGHGITRFGSWIVTDGVAA